MAALGRTTGDAVEDSVKSPEVLLGADVVGHHRRPARHLRHRRHRPATYEALRRRGETVRLVNRSGHARVPDDVEVVGGDAADRVAPERRHRGRMSP
jgi:hypothetical protein